VLAAVVLGVVVAAAAVLPSSRPPVEAAGPTCANGSYTVVRGDSWSAIAVRAKVSLASLLSTNAASTTTAIFPGTVVCLPAGATPIAAPATGSSTTTTTTQPGTVPTVTLAQFPVQGPCWFTDTWHAPRGGGRLHEGVDLIARQGQYVYAADAGTLTIQYWDAPGRLAGNGWRLTRADGTYFFYAHLSAFAPGLKVGSTVVAGQIIGFIGSTGNSSTPHLHFEVHPGGGAAINPTALVRAIDGCKVTAVPPQPSGVVPTPPQGTPTTTPAPVPTTTPPTTPTTAPASPGVPLGNGSPTSTGSAWTFVSPQTAYSGRVAAGRTTVRVPTLPGVNRPSGVLVRLESTTPNANGFLTVHPCAQTPSSSSLNLVPNRFSSTTVPVLVRDGSFCVTASTATDIRIDVVAGQSSQGVGVLPVVATRALDTRTTTALVPGTPVPMPLARLGVPAGTRAVTATFTAIGPSSAGTLSIGPCGAGSWTARLGTAPLQSFSLTVRISDGGLCVSSSVTVHLVVDITGAWAPTSSGAGGLSPLGPTRAFDSRSSGPVGNDTRTVELTGLPAGTARVMVSVAAVGLGVDGAVFAWPCSQPRPAAALGANTGSNVTSFSVPMAGTTLCLAATTPMHVVVDVTAAG
jgi:hypothetical protein